MIYYDFTEANQRSKARKALLKIDERQNHCGSVQGLEEMTGADILVTPLAEPKLPGVLQTNLLPHKVMLKKLCKSGHLVQRKSGRDACNSIPEYSRILAKMRDQSDFAWLLTTGRYTKNKTGNVAVGGFETGYRWEAFTGARRAWQLDGGLYDHLDSDGNLFDWLVALESYLINSKDKPKVILPRRMVRDVIGGNGENDPVMTLTTLPHIGAKLAWDCWKHWGNLAVCLYWLSNPELYETDPSYYPSGIGPKTVQDIHNWLGGRLELWRE